VGHRKIDAKVAIMTLSRTAKKFYQEQLTKKRVSAASIVTAGTLVATQTLGASSAHASSGVFTVSNCDDAGSGSFRQAIQDAYDFNDPSQIVFSSSLGCSTIRILSDLPAERVSLDIVGPGADKLTVEFSDASPAGLTFGSSADQINISGLTFAGRGVTSDSGGTVATMVHINGVHFKDVGSSGWTVPIAINSAFPESLVVVENSTFSNSDLVAGAYSGWAIMATGALVVDNSTFVGNVFQEGVLAAGSAVSISNSTFVGNTFAAQDIQMGAFSVGHYVPNTSGNPGQLRLNGNLFASNVLSGSATCWSDDEIDNGANIFDDVYPGCTPAVLPYGMQSNGASAVIPGMAAQLASAPALNGGTTPTVALLAGSPAINYYSNGDTGVNFQPPSLDQRGLSRPSGTSYDVGAYEFRASVTPPVLPSSSCAAINLGPVNFKRDSAVLTTTAKRQLNSYVAKIAKSSCHTVTLNGYSAAPSHTTKASTKARIKLARARATAVKSYLVSTLKAKGVTAKFKVNALGAKNPVATNKTELGQRQNRRVEVLVSKLRALR